MSRTAPRPWRYRASRRLAAAHRSHGNAAYPACSLCIVVAMPIR